MVAAIRPDPGTSLSGVPRFSPRLYSDLVSEQQWHPETRVVAAGRPDRTKGAAVNPPVVLSSTYLGTGEPQPGDKVYTRWGTETWEPLEEALAGLEGAAHPAVVFSSGMAAVDAALSLVRPGGALVVPNHAYHASLIAADELSERSGVQVTPVPIADSAAVIQALQAAAQGTTASPDDRGRRPVVLWVESPTNPSLEIADIPELVKHTHALGGLVIVDNTFATPLGQRPLELGADVVVHSVTKAIAGHSDVLLGAVLTNSEVLAATIRGRRTLGGAIAGPWEAWLALRGLRTLALRLERASANAAELARRLQGHDLVEEVVYPGLESHPQHDRAQDLLDSFGSILTLRPKGGAAGADRLVNAVRLWVPATSLGGVESSLERRRRFATEAADIPADLLRLSVGIENIEDIWADLLTALQAAAQG